jgi:hypothetical protein
MVHYLQSINREATFQEVAEAAEREGYAVYPATFGRAQAIVGIVEAPQVLQRPFPAPATAQPAAATPLAPPAPPSPPEPLEPLPAQRPAMESPGAVDPITGLMIFMTALDDLDKDRQRFRQSVSAMLSVVQQALASGPH